MASATGIRPSPKSEPELRRVIVQLQKEIADLKARVKALEEAS